jgi:hypothetical protein
MARYNPELMQLDDGATGTQRVFGPRTDTSQISEEDMYKASRDAAIELGVDPVTLAYEAGMAGDTSKPMNKMTPAERSAFAKGRSDKQKQDREATQSGNNPDNPMPSEDPGPGMYWANYGGTWRKYKYVTNAPADSNDNGNGNDGDGNDGSGNDNGNSTSGGDTGFYTASDGKTFKDSDAFTVYQSGLDEKKQSRVSAYNLLYDEFDKYGLGSLVSDIRNILTEGSLDPAEFSLKVRGTDAYKARFIANEARLAKGLKALSPADYIALEDKYQEVMRQYGLPESYYAKTGTGVQEGFRKLIENDVSNLELEDRISTAQKRVINANPEVTAALKQFYPDINNADILAYTLDPKNAIENIKRKVTNAEIGGAALQAGLQTGLSRAEELQKYGVDQAAAEKGFGTIAGGLQRGSQLASIYGEDPYTQTTAETEVFGLAGAQEAAKQRKKLTGLEKAAFTGQTGLSSGALVRDRAGAY